MSVHQAAPSDPPTAGTTPASGGNVPEYALWAVIVGVTLLAVLDGVALVLFHGDATKVVEVIGAVDSPIAVIISAYFGIKVGTDAGAAGKAEAERARGQATQQVISLVAQMQPEVAKPVLRRLGVPVADD